MPRKINSSKSTVKKVTKTTKTVKKKQPKSQEILSKQSKAEAFLIEFNKSMKGRAQLKRASDYVLPFLTKRLPTGILSLDLALKGGFPAGGFSQIAGPKNSNKTWIMWQVIRNLQQQLGDKMSVLLAMTEMRADRSQARLSGVKIALGEEDSKRYITARKLAGLPDLTDEEREDLKTEIGRIDEMHAISGEHLYDGILRAVEYDIYHLIVIDSIGIIMTAAEAESESLLDKQYAGASAVNTKFLRKLSGFLTMDTEEGTPRETCVLGINQVREKIGKTFHANAGELVRLKSPGGKALEHAQFVNLVMISGSPIGDNISRPTTEGAKQMFVQRGKTVNWVIEKGKAGIHEGTKGSFNYDFKTGDAEFILDTIVEGEKAGVIEKAGPWYRIPNPKIPENNLLVCQGKDALIKALQDDIETKFGTNEITFYQYIRNQCLQKQGIFINYNWD